MEQRREGLLASSRAFGSSLRSKSIPLFIPIRRKSFHINGSSIPLGGRTDPLRPDSPCNVARSSTATVPERTARFFYRPRTLPNTLSGTPRRPFSRLRLEGAPRAVSDSGIRSRCIEPDSRTTGVSCRSRICTSIYQSPSRIPRVRNRAEIVRAGSIGAAVPVSRGDTERPLRRKLIAAVGKRQRGYF